MVNVEGRNPVIESLKAGRKISRILLQSGSRGKKINFIKNEAGERGIPLEVVSKNKLDKIARSNVHQGVIALAEQIKLYTLKDILELAEERNEPPFVVILDQIQDPHNFGSIIRTSYAAGAHGIIFPADRSASLTPAVLKAAAGAAEHIMFAEVTNINYTIEKLKEEGLWIAGADIKGESHYYDADLTGSIGLVVGNEGTGLRRLVKENCDFLIKIPMKGKLGSLNASVAAGIIIYEIIRQRG